jgi:hypothetical protein
MKNQHFFFRRNVLSSFNLFADRLHFFIQFGDLSFFILTA